MPNQFAKDATKLYYQIRKTNKNYKFSNALKDLSIRLNAEKTKTAKNMKHKNKPDTIENASANNVNPMKSVSNKKNKTHRMKHRQTRRH